MHNELDRLAENAFAREKGFAEGEAKGRAEGEVKRSVATAKALLPILPNFSWRVNF